MAQIKERKKSIFSIAIYLGRDKVTGKRTYHNQTFKGTKNGESIMKNRLITKQNSSIEMCQVIPELVNSHISYLFEDNIKKSKQECIYDSLHKLLNGNYDKYTFTNKSINKIINTGLDENEFQGLLSNLNEKTNIRKKNGVYYTPSDVSAFIIYNSIFQKLYAINNRTPKVVNENNFIKRCSIKEREKIWDKIIDMTIFDPTCGTGEFLLKALEIKVEALLKLKRQVSVDDYLRLLKSIYGNDINIESIEITKLRLFFYILKFLKSKDVNVCDELTKILNNNLSNYDFVEFNHRDCGKHDLIIGNPPYVEDRKSNSKPAIKYGNIYANVIHNSIQLLKDDGVLGFIIPLSYISTPRMNKIRAYVEEHTNYQCVLNYADRPDCLFNSVHQKLSILITKKGTEEHKLFTSGYKYWYKNERNMLFSNVTLQKNQFRKPSFYPKLGNAIDNSIMKKVYTETDYNLLDMVSSNDGQNIFLNMRACFWIKAFSFNPGSKEYKSFNYNDDIYNFILCLMNSSLFFWYWIAVSDCWHITNKELKHFLVITNDINIDKYRYLSEKLEDKLERTKKYIGTKQTDYEYKHKLCKNIIDGIDDELAITYNLTNEELNYIKNFSLSYRESRGG